jgi:GntR family transcriptional regulator, transcriptional repressor for pyruvate dehydrogenase complex
MRYSSRTIAGLPGCASPSAGGEVVYKLIRTSRLYEQIVQQIEESIVKGTLKAGDQLPAERELAQRFGVSRTAVREAVKALREKGLVEAYSGRGTFITDGTTQAVRQSFDLMVKIGQPEGSTHLAEVRASSSRRLRRSRPRIQEPNWQPCVKQWPRWTGPARIRKPTSKPISIFIWRWPRPRRTRSSFRCSIPSSALLREQRLRIFKVPGGPERGQVHHKRILEAVERHDAEKAREPCERILIRCETIVRLAHQKRISGKHRTNYGGGTCEVRLNKDFGAFKGVRLSLHRKLKVKRL